MASRGERTRFWAVLVFPAIASAGILAGHGCSNAPSVECQSSPECDLHPAGTCLEAATGRYWCAYGDTYGSDCVSGLRWSEIAGDGLARACVETATPDAATDSGRPDAAVDAGQLDTTTDAPYVDASPDAGADAPVADAAPDASSTDAAAGTEFAYGYGSSGDDVGAAIDTDSSNDVVLAGSFTGSISFGGSFLASDGAGNPDAFLAKISCTGSHVWSRQLGGDSTEHALGVAADAVGDVIAVGQFTGTVDFGSAAPTAAGSFDAFVAKYASAGGAPLWAIRLGGTGHDAASSVAVDDSRDVVVAGIVTSSADIGGGMDGGFGGIDAFVAKYAAADGGYVWGNRVGGSGTDRARALAVSPPGDVFVVYDFTGTANFGGADMVSAGVYDLVLARYSPIGVHEWSLRHGSSNIESPEDVALDSEGNLVVAGSFYGTTVLGGSPLTSAGADDIFVAKYSGLDGAHQWSVRFGGLESDEATGVTVGPDGKVYVAGSFRSDVNFGGGTIGSNAGTDDIFLLELDGATGAYLSLQHFGGAGTDSPNGMTLDHSGHLVVIGTFEQFIDFGVGFVSAAVGVDLFVARLLP